MDTPVSYELAREAFDRATTVEECRDAVEDLVTAMVIEQSILIDLFHRQQASFGWDDDEDMDE